MIRGFKHKGLRLFFETGNTGGINPNHARRLRVRLDAMDVAEQIELLNRPGWDLHPLKGDRAGRWSLRVNGPWRLTFGFADGDCHDVDYEQYH